MDVLEIAKKLIFGKRESEERVAEAHRDGNQVIYGGYGRFDCDAIPEVENGITSGKELDCAPEQHDHESAIFDLGKPITCLMLTCEGCDKIDPVKGCIAYEDPSALLWHKLGQWCPLNSVSNPFIMAFKKKKGNPLKDSKRRAREKARTKAAS